MDPAQPSHVLLLTSQEHEEVFTHLLKSIDQHTAARLSQILRGAEARGKQTARQELSDLLRQAMLTSSPSRPSRWRSSYTTIALWVILIALFVCFYNIFSRL